MKRSISAVLLFLQLAFFLGVAPAFAAGVAPAADKPVSVTPSELMPAGKFYVDPSTFLRHRFGSDKVLIAKACSIATDANCLREHGPTVQGPNGEYRQDNGTLPRCPAAGSAYVQYCYNETWPNFYGQLNGSTYLSNGSVRFGCSVSHMSLDDPIVFGTQSGRSHLHEFFGNTTTGPGSDLMHFADVGKSTCAGGKINRTGYWVPVLIYHCPASSVDPSDRSYGCDRSRDGKAYPAEQSLFYYKCGTDFTADCSSVTWFPKGFRMIVGSASGNDNSAARGQFACFWRNPSNPDDEHQSNNSAPNVFNHLPTKAESDALMLDGNPLPCNNVNMMIDFYPCWDGVNLDSPNHISHVREGTGAINECPDPAFSHLVPRIGLNIHTNIHPEDLPYLRLSSDQPKATATGPCATALQNWCSGTTRHADWVNGWDETPNFNGWGQGTITDIIRRECYDVPKQATDGVPRSRDCHANLMGWVNGDLWYLVTP